jgi:hypothetical protein
MQCQSCERSEGLSFCVQVSVLHLQTDCVMNTTEHSEVTTPVICTNSCMSSIRKVVEMCDIFIDQDRRFDTVSPSAAVIHECPLQRIYVMHRSIQLCNNMSGYCVQYFFHPPTVFWSGNMKGGDCMGQA